MIDENEFFRTLTLKICGNLEIEEGLRACVEFLSGLMPAYRLYFDIYERELGAMRLVARASAERGERLDLLVPLPEEGVAGIERIREAWSAGRLPTVIVQNDPSQNPITRTIAEVKHEPPSAVMVLPLEIADQAAGLLTLCAEGEKRFEERHAELFALVKEPFFVAMSNTLKHEEVVKLKDRLSDDNRYLNRELMQISGDEIVGADFGLREVMEKVGMVAPTDSPVLISGETGVGKEVIANAIHLQSPRRDGPFITVNCGAIPDSLLDSELFGHEKGAFTGALSRKRGRFERANRGTILLDEIGEMPFEAQVRLLHVLQSSEIERIGGTERIPLDIRVIAATNRDPVAMVRDGRFREDLFFRLNVFPIVVPPLRQRTGDIASLVNHFIEKKSKKYRLPTGITLAPGEMDRLKSYAWPGNVRELENMVERALILNRKGPLEIAVHVTSSTDDETTEVSGNLSPGSPCEATLDAVIDSHIRSVLERAKGRIEGSGGAAEILGVNPSTLRNRMKKLGISYGRRK